MSEADSGLVDGNASQAPEADSGPDTGDAGNPDLALDAALDAAFDAAQEAGSGLPDPEDRSLHETAGGERGGEGAGSDGSREGGDDQVGSLRAPEHWPAERRQAFETLATPQAKRALLDMARDLEAGVTRKSQELSEQARFADAIRAEITEEDRQLLAAQGLDESAGIRQLLALNRYARQDPSGYVRHVMQALGVNADSVRPAASSPNRFGSSGGAVSDHQQTGHQQGLPDLVDQRVNAILHDRAVADATSVFETFKSEKGSDGNPIHPHVETVRAMMSTLARQPHYAQLPTTIESYKTLYDVAVRAHPETRDQIMERDIAAQLAAQGKAHSQRSDVEKARRAASPVRATGTPPGPAQRADATLDDILDDAFRQLV